MHCTSVGKFSKEYRVQQNTINGSLAEELLWSSRVPLGLHKGLVEKLKASNFQNRFLYLNF